MHTFYKLLNFCLIKCLLFKHPLELSQLVLTLRQDLSLNRRALGFLQRVQLNA